MKRVLVILMIVVLVGIVAACGGGDTQEGDQSVILIDPAILEGEADGEMDPSLELGIQNLTPPAEDDQGDQALALINERRTEQGARP
ncbi:MAG: hypothetical protein HC893_05565 [Chloroflexaceae bacterium]|nr:hypothetical protein [Chloroflexaceae bacterium]